MEVRPNKNCSKSNTPNYPKCVEFWVGDHFSNHSLMFCAKQTFFGFWNFSQSNPPPPPNIDFWVGDHFSGHSLMFWAKQFFGFWNFIQSNTPNFHQNFDFWVGDHFSGNSLMFCAKQTFFWFWNFSKKTKNKKYLHIENCPKAHCLPYDCV